MMIEQEFSQFNCKKAFEVSSLHGEAPHYSPERKELFWVDIEGQMLCRGEPSSGEVKSVNFVKKVTCVVSSRDNDKLILSLSDSVAIYSLSQARLISEISLETIVEGVRFNDGKVAPEGSFIVGTMSETPNQASLYRFDGAEKGFVEIIDKVSVSNGLDWSRDRFLYIDSPTKQLSIFPWPPSPRLDRDLAITVALKGLKPEELPDGMCLDQAGNPWIAIWGGGRVSRFDPNTGIETARINVPCSFVTSCCFGGAEFNQLFITTAKNNDKSLQAGAVFVADLEGMTTGNAPHLAQGI